MTNEKPNESSENVETHEPPQEGSSDGLSEESLAQLEHETGLSGDFNQVKGSDTVVGNGSQHVVNESGANATAGSSELIDQFEEFLVDYYRGRDDATDDLLKLARGFPQDKRSLHVEWSELYAFDPDLAEDYRAQPGQIHEYLEEALRCVDLPIEVSLSNAHVRVNLPTTADIEIRSLRAHHRGEYISVNGIVRKATDVNPKLTEAAFECQRCGTLTRIPQTGTDFQEPHECHGCERQGPFRINFDQSEFIDAQKIRVQESPEGLRGGETPQSIDIHIEDDITGEVTAGDQVRVSGTLHLEQRSNGPEKSPIFDMLMDGGEVSRQDTSFEDIEITDRDVEQIKEIADSPAVYQDMIDSVAPTIYGYETEKLAMLMQLFSGVTKHLPDGSRIRGDMHMLLIGDPGCHEPGTELLTYDGGRMRVENIEAGDRLMGPDSEPRTVLRTASGRQDMYEIVPVKGEPFTVNKDHVLTLVKSGSAGRNEDGDIVDITVSDYLEWPETPKHQHKLLRTGVEFPSNGNGGGGLPIDPYFLGVLIGDAQLTGTPVINTDEQDVINQLDSLAKNAGVTACKGADEKVSFAGNKGALNPLTKQLRKLGLDVISKEKHLPRCYRTASRRDRLHLLAGLIDTDGHLYDNGAGYEYSTASEQLADDVAFLVRSLGLATSVSEKEVQLDGWGASRTYYRLSISGDCSVIPCRVERKQSAERKQIKNVLRTGFSVESVGEGTYHGVTLLEDPHYVMGDFTVTHNTGKSMLLQYIRNIAPRSVYTSGKGSSAAGLTAAAVRDDFGDGNQWTLEAGALVLADRGIAAVDEIDKMSPEDRSAMHEALEQQTISVSKAGINATLKARCSLLAAANPQYGRFDRYEDMGEQINLEPALISRFDLIFTVTDEPNPEEDSDLAKHIIRTNRAGEMSSQQEALTNPHSTPEEAAAMAEEVEPEISPDLLRKYIAYARSTTSPTMTDEAESIIEEFYVGLRSEGQDADSPVPVTARKLEAIVRLTEASARIRLSNVATEEDATRAVRIIRTCLESIGYDHETGQFDADIVETGQSKSQRDRIKSVKEIVAELQSQSDEKQADVEEVLNRATEVGMDRHKAEHEIEQLKRRGEMYEPSTGYLRST